MPRWLHMLVACLILLAVSGAPAMAASVLHVDPCVDDCDEARENDDQQDCPDEGDRPCSPFCHGCACFSLYTRLDVLSVPLVFVPVGPRPTFVAVDGAPPGAPISRVFHPPRLAA